MEWSQKNQEEWEGLNEKLQHLLMLEIKLRQDILSNLNQQEYTLLVGDIELKEELHYTCAKTAKELQSQAQQRNSLMRKMTQLLSPSHAIDAFEDLFHSDREEEAETLLLYRNLQALTEKIHDQKIRNKTLYSLIQKGTSLDVATPALQTKPLCAEGQKKTLLITIDYPEKDHPNDTN